MKAVSFITILISVLSLAGCGSSSAGKDKETNPQVSDTGMAILSFTAMEHDFGKVEEGEKVGCIFTFENKGSKDMVITRASTSCGCTVPKYDARPIEPGGRGSLEVVFNSSGYSGVQTKTISVHSNASVPVLVLKITAEVINNSNN